MKQEQIYQKITDAVIQSLDAGHVPWEKPWGQIGHRNPVTKRYYGFLNTLILTCDSINEGYKSPYWVTFLQAKKKGGYVKKGEKASQIIFWSTFEVIEVNDDEEEEIKEIPFMKLYSVFNIEQCENVSVEENEVENILSCEEIVEAYLDMPKIAYGSPCYYPDDDTITMPLVNEFKTPEHYYSALFHEMAHSTGHGSRLNRKEITGEINLDRENCSREELVAEIASAFLCNRAKINNGVEKNKTAYINGWVKYLKENVKEIVLAASRAQKACEYILNGAAS